MRKLSVVIVAALTLVGVGISPVWPQSTMVDGQITKIDHAAGKLTIKHGPLKKFDMDGMTMVFRAQDPAMLKSVKEGDKIKFDVDKINGQFTVIKMEKAK